MPESNAAAHVRRARKEIENMNLQQMRYLSEIVDQALNVSKAAIALHTTQPGISRQIRLLEQALGVVLLKRNKTRVAGVTDIGYALLRRMCQIRLDADAIRRQATVSTSPQKEGLSIATTHTLARYVLPKIFKRRAVLRAVQAI